MKERNHLEDLGVDGRTVLRWSIEKQDGRVLSEFIWLRIKTIGGLL
jgi:hypothetical protein